MSICVTREGQITRRQGDYHPIMGVHNGPYKMGQKNYKKELLSEKPNTVDF